MTPTQQRAEQLDALAKLRDIRTMADEVIGTLECVLTSTATTTPVLREPERPEWLPICRAAQVLGVEKNTLAQRCRRGGIRAGIARKVGGGWQIRLDLMAPSSRRPAR
ncbi:hypothetical protein [Methylobacterium longum]|uniref:Helix-turn-helix domain-containing protein n=1 Tax=Methylobacterium longum TaxID=767694 RepID=A0ABT8ANI2_9HYPH|nr:hypothetical protein [Methylobacterium longum]MDN3571449.1 hypothetical protein [Methylobacterium longum]GJE12573.1 hypothetical protein FOHLNKBM_3623 [Methylobacterium longum]